MLKIRRLFSEAISVAYERGLTYFVPTLHDPLLVPVHQMVMH